MNQEPNKENTNNIKAFENLMKSPENSNHPKPTSKDFYIFPSIRDFSIKIMTEHITKFIETWNLSLPWKFCVNIVSHATKSNEDIYCFEAKFSQPTNESPIPLATASIFFRVKINRLASDTEPCQVAYQFEGFHSFYDTSMLKQFQEYHLKKIVECKKLLLRKQLYECDYNEIFEN